MQAEVRFAHDIPHRRKVRFYPERAKYKSKKAGGSKNRHRGRPQKGGQGQAGCKLIFRLWNKMKYPVPQSFRVENLAVDFEIVKREILEIKDFGLGVRVLVNGFVVLGKVERMRMGNHQPVG